MQRLLTQNAGYGVFEADRLTAFALRRAAGRGHIIGPVVAGADMDAIALVRRHFTDLDDELVRLDTISDNNLLLILLRNPGWW